MRRISTLTTAVAVACGACQPLPDTLPSTTQPASTQPPATQPSCSSYTVPVTVGGQPQQAVIEACQQADGSWRITQTTPGLPSQVYEVPAPTYSPYSSGYSYPEAFSYPYSDLSPYWGWDEWGWGGSPWFLGFAPSIVVVQRFNHFHHGLGRGFGHGFGRGFGHGFGHGFAGMRGRGMAGGRR
jgi:surface antigen